MSDISTIGVDIGKLVMYVCGMTKQGRVVMRKKLYRDEFLSFMREQKRCLVGMEACGGAHYWGRELEKLGFEVRLMPAQYVKPYVKTNKNDTNDAEACAEAVNRPTMRFVRVKSEFQQEMSQLHRARERLVGSRTALSNEIRGFLMEFGVVLPQGQLRLSSRVYEIMSDEKNVFPVMFIKTMKQLLEELSEVEKQVEYYDRELRIISKSHPTCKQIMTIPGIGELTATALVAKIGAIEHFKSSRQFSAYLGLVPRQSGTGGKARLGKISKRGDVYIRKLLVQGSYTVMQHAAKKQDRTSLWINAQRVKSGTRSTAVALANKNARIVWALLSHNQVYKYHQVQEAA
jgi:transposase